METEETKLIVINTVIIFYFMTIYLFIDFMTSLKQSVAFQKK